MNSTRPELMAVSRPRASKPIKVQSATAGILCADMTTAPEGQRARRTTSISAESRNTALTAQAMLSDASAPQL